MYWYWKIRIYAPSGDYVICEVRTGRNLLEIDVIQDFYIDLTGQKLLLEGMSEEPSKNELPTLQRAFYQLYRE